MKLTVILPVYNEEKSVEPIVEKLIAVTFPSIVSDVEIIIVDDGSADSSLAISKRLAKTYDSVKAISHAVNRGKGAAVKTGISHSSGDICIVQDADEELSPRDIPALIDAMILSKVDLVNGSRFMNLDHLKNTTRFRNRGNKVLSRMVSLITGTKITDVTCGYKLFKRSLWDQLTLKEEGFAFEVEFMIKAIRQAKARMVEVPVQYKPRKTIDGKKIKQKDAFVILHAIIKYGLLSKR